MHLHLDAPEHLPLLCFLLLIGFFTSPTVTSLSSLEGAEGFEPLCLCSPQLKMFPSLAMTHRVKLDECKACFVRFEDDREEDNVYVVFLIGIIVPHLCSQLQLTEKTQHFLKTLTRLPLQSTRFRLPWISTQGHRCVEPEQAEMKSHSPTLQLLV